MYSGIPFFDLVYPILEKNIIPDQMVSHKALIRIIIVIHYRDQTCFSVH